MWFDPFVFPDSGVVLISYTHYSIVDPTNSIVVVAIVSKVHRRASHNVSICDGSRPGVEFVHEPCCILRFVLNP